MLFRNFRISEENLILLSLTKGNLHDEAFIVNVKHLGVYFSDCTCDRHFVRASVVLDDTLVRMSILCKWTINKTQVLKIHIKIALAPPALALKGM